MHTTPSTAHAGQPAACGITGHALVSARLSDISALRERPAPPGAPALPARFLRHCDEHAVVGMHAILRVLASRGPECSDVSRHAVVSASCQLGRLAAAKTLANLATGGGVSVSPHIVPQCSLHSVAGAVSVGLGMHGPHLGVGGGTDALAEGLFAAATLMRASGTTGEPPCVWLVATEWEGEPALDDAGTPVDDQVCSGLAVAIEPDAPDQATDDDRHRVAAPFRTVPAPLRKAAVTTSSLSLTLRFPEAARLRVVTPSAAGRLADFARALDMCREGTALVSWALECPWGAEIRVSRRPGAATERLRGAA